MESSNWDRCNLTQAIGIKWHFRKMKHLAGVLRACTSCSLDWVAYSLWVIEGSLAASPPPLSRHSTMTKTEKYLSLCTHQNRPDTSSDPVPPSSSSSSSTEQQQQPPAVLLGSASQWCLLHVASFSCFPNARRQGRHASKLSLLLHEPSRNSQTHSSHTARENTYINCQSQS